LVLEESRTGKVALLLLLTEWMGFEFIYSYWRGKLSTKSGPNKNDFSIKCVQRKLRGGVRVSQDVMRWAEEGFGNVVIHTCQVTSIVSWFTLYRGPVFCFVF
jgi:hypothetical protein